MLKLIKLEWKKNRIGKYIGIALVLAGLLCLFVFAQAFWGIANDPGTGVPDAAEGKNMISPTIELFTSMVYLVFTSVMLSVFIVRAYKNKTMNLMFSYPIKRRKILVSQMLSVWIFNFAALLCTKLLIYACIMAGSRFMDSAFPVDFDMGSLFFYLQLILKTAVIVSMSLIALFVGLALKSPIAAVLTSFVLIFLTQANVGDFTLADSTVFPLVLTAISLLCAFFSVWHVETKDLM